MPSEARRTWAQDWEEVVTALPCWILHLWHPWTDDDHLYSHMRGRASHQERICKKCGERQRRYVG